MFSDDGYLGCPNGVQDLISLNTRLNSKVIEQVNDSQELVLLNNFSRESNEYQFKKCLQERISDIVSWRWVLEDLSKRLDEAIGALRYEHNALRVVVERVQKEINEHSREASRPGALKPLSDAVEEAITEEFNFLRDEKKKFEKMIPELEKQTMNLEKTKKRIEVDMLNKQEALSVEESCANIDLNDVSKINSRKKSKRRFSPLSRWENRCTSLKRAGLRALTNAVITRQQVRGARVHLSIEAQAFAARVDAALRRRLHTNTSKLQELEWQRGEAIKDIKSLDEEMVTAEQNLIETLEQEQVVAARITDRTLRPAGELTRDDVDTKLRDELSRLKHFTKHLRSNIDRISSLQKHLMDSITQIDCCAEDIAQVVRLDEDRIRSRLGDVNGNSETSYDGPPAGPSKCSHTSVVPSTQGTTLTAVMEEDENEEYPFDD
ncbi:tektin-2-like [Achroia grisella]|uniref:tektin-2-like n=1 Tax=Achroia grisella TaxID=688607 RepID=UPI0027D22457|nr:tektin-2-like [Achroia grisella]